jgi:serine/threonine protein kinase
MQDQLLNLLQRFQAEWRGGVRPQLSAFICNVDQAALPGLLRSLLEFDLKQRIERGELPIVDEYRSILSGVEFDWSGIFSQALSAVATARERLSDDTSVSQEATQTFQNLPILAETSPPEQIGRYRLGRELGRGYAGVVFSAQDELLRRDVALKMPRPDANRDEAWIDRFVDEARLVAGLSNPAIVPVFDCGRLADGNWFIVYELITGGTLYDELQRGRPEVTRVVELVIRIAEGLHCAHQQGVYHRDLKPRNILISEDRRPRIADFGLAIQEEALNEHRDAVAGSPAYMSPEQVRGDSHLLDGRTDIWSLGVIFYEMLTQQRPFRGNTIPNLFELILKKEPRPPRQLDESIDKELERICLKCLQKSASDRYLVAIDLVDDLAKWNQTRSNQFVKSGSHQEEAQVASVHDARPRSSKTMWLQLTGSCLIAVVVAILTASLSGWFRHKLPESKVAEFAKVPKMEVGLLPEKPVAVQKSIPRLGDWNSLLNQTFEAVVKPDDMSSTRWDLNKLDGTLSILSDHYVVLNFGRVEAPNYELRLKYHQANWTGGVGICWDGQLVPGLSGSQQLSFQMVMSPPLMPRDKDRVVRLRWGQFKMQRNGIQGMTMIWRDELREIPVIADCELLVRIRNRRLHDVTWNGVTLENFAQMPRNIPSSATSPQGDIGLSFSKTQIVVQDFSIKILE